MRKTIKKILTVALAAVVAVSAFTPVTVQAAPYAPENVTVYMTSKDSNSSYVSFTVSNLKKSDTIKKSSLKSSKKSVATLNYLYKYSDVWSYKYSYFNGNKDSVSKYDSYQYTINLNAKKPGTTKVTYKVNDKKYTTTVKVLKYANPVESLKITGVSSGKNVAGKTKNQNNADLKLKKDVSNATVTVEAAKNWKITNVYFYTYKKSNDYYNNDGTYTFYDYNTGKNKVTLRPGSLKKAGRYQVNVNLRNTKTGGTLYCTYFINY